MPHQVFNLSEIAEYLHIAPRDVERLIRNDEIPYERAGDRYVFRKKEVAAWASRRILGFDSKELHAFHASSSDGGLEPPDRNLILPRLMKVEYIEPNLPARTRSAAIREMVVVGDRTHLVNYKEDLLESILAREELCSTAMAGGYALLHPRHHEPYMFEDAFVAMGRTRNPIPFGAPDGGTTDLFLVCCGEDRLHLHALARLCCVLARPDVLDGLREAPHANDIFNLLLNAEAGLVHRA